MMMTRKIICKFIFHLSTTDRFNKVCGLKTIHKGNQCPLEWDAREKLFYNNAGANNVNILQILKFVVLVEFLISPITCLINSNKS